MSQNSRNIRVGFKLYEHMTELLQCFVSECAEAEKLQSKPAQWIVSPLLRFSGRDATDCGKARD